MWLSVPSDGDESAASAPAWSLAHDFDIWLLVGGKPTQVRSSEVDWSKVPWTHVLDLWMPELERARRVQRYLDRLRSEPCESSVCARAMADWTRESSPLPQGEPSATSNVKATPLPSSDSTCSMATSDQLRSGMTSPPSTAIRGEDSSTSSVPDSHVNRRASLAGDSAPKTSVGSGPKSGASRKRVRLASSSSKTSPASSRSTKAKRSSKSSKRWPRAGGLRNTTVHQRVPSAPRTSVIVSSCSLPTPTSSQYGSSQNGSNGVGGEHERPSAGTLSLATRARRGMSMLPTPTASDAERTSETFMRGNETLLGAARQLPTPLASSYRQVGARNNTRSGETLLEAAVSLPTPQATDFKRNGEGKRNGTKGGRRLAAEAQMLPTPTTRPNSHRSGHDAIGQSDRGVTLTQAASNLMLPTPVARDHKGSGRAGQLPTELLPTPRASDATKGARSISDRDGKEGPTLVEAINKLAQRGTLPTPTAQDARASGVAGNWTPESGRNSGATLTDVAVRQIESGSSTPGESTGIGGARLSARFVGWMMGLPIGWVEIP